MFYSDYGWVPTVQLSDGVRFLQGAIDNYECYLLSSSTF